MDNMTESLESAQTRGTEYGRNLIQGVTTQKLILGAGFDNVRLGSKSSTQIDLYIAFLQVGLHYMHDGISSSSLEASQIRGL